MMTDYFIIMEQDLSPTYCLSHKIKTMTQGGFNRKEQYCLQHNQLLSELPLHVLDPNDVNFTLFGIQ